LEIFGIHTRSAIIDYILYRHMRRHIQYIVCGTEPIR
jgi:hypothetical protein